MAEVVGDFVQLKRKGKDFTACCPFHQEKTPSFYVSAIKGIYKCFGCGKAGDSVRFLMELEGMTYPDALRWLAAKYGIEIEETAAPNSEEARQQSERESLLIALQFAARFYQQQLKDTTEGRSIGLSYFRQRGINDRSIETFGLGWAPEARDGLWQAARREGYDQDIMLKAGLVAESHGQIIDRFRARVMFPVYNASGKVIAFGGRTLSKEKTVPKYINSPETPVYNKSQVLYGLFQARQTVRQKDLCYLTEGYLDVIAMHQAGFENVVASSGTSLTTEQIRLVRRYTHNISVLYDGDAAGIKASMRGIDMLLEEGMNVWALTLPDGDDPDSYLQKAGSQAFEEHLKQHSRNFIGFKAQLLSQEAAGDPLKRAAFIRDLVASIVKVPDAIARSVFYKEVASLVQIDEEVLIREGNKMLLEHSRKGPGGSGGSRSGTGSTPSRPPGTGARTVGPGGGGNWSGSSAAPPADFAEPTYGQEPDWEGFPPPEQAPPEGFNDWGGGDYVHHDEPPYVIAAGEPVPGADPTAPPQDSLDDLNARAIMSNEREHMRLLLHYAATVIDEEETLFAEAVLSELEGIEFQTPIYARMLQLLRDELLAGRVPVPQWFSGHADELVATEAANLLATRHTLSENWQAKHNIFVASEESQLVPIANQTLLYLHYNTSMRQLRQNLSRMRHASTEEEADACMQLHIELSNKIKIVSAQLGRVVN